MKTLYKSHGPWIDVTIPLQREIFVCIHKGPSVLHTAQDRSCTAPRPSYPSQHGVKLKTRVFAWYMYR